MYSSLFTIGLLLVSFINHRIFISAILKHIFSVKLEDEKKPQLIKQKSRLIAFSDSIKRRLSLS
jgi:hypothetical protein